MEKKIVSNKYFKELIHFGPSCNSILYVDDNDLIKRMYEPVYDETYEKREQRLELIGDIIGKEYLVPKYLVYINKLMPSNLEGYGMDFVSNYKPVSSISNSKNYSHKEKLEICKKICDAITGLERYGVSYWDVHSENVLVNKDDIKICDMDAVTTKKIDGEFLYRVDLAQSYKHLTSLVLSILYGMDEFDLIKVLERKRSRRFVKNSKMFSRVVDTEGYVFYPDKYLDDFTEDYVNETKALIKH